MEKRKIGILGGTFDPIHLGHLILAETIMEECALNRVVFIPAADPPHKNWAQGATPRQRYEMVQLAIESNPAFGISDMEIKRQGPSYSRDTLAQLVQEHGEDAEFYFIVGADSIVTLHTWNRVEELLTLCHFIGASRRGSEPDRRILEKQFGELARKIHCIVTPEWDISSTDIRSRIQQGKSIKYIVPEKVEQYIYGEKIYASMV